MQIVIVSDIHLNSYFSKKEKFLNLVKDLETDILVINGDLYDLHIGPPQEDIIARIKENKKIKDIVYIRGNHDFYIKDYFPYYNVQDVFRIADIVVMHGYQYDVLTQNIPSDKGWSIWITKIRYFLEKTFKINFRLIIKKASFGLLDKILLKAHIEAIEVNPCKKVILSHTHLPINKHPYYNTGCMVDDFFTYMVIDIREKESNILLLGEKSITPP